MKKSDFYMVLPSNSCPLNHPNNTAANFIVEFQNPIYFKGQWEVALQEFSFVYSPFEILSKSKIEWRTKKNDKIKFKVYTSEDDPSYEGSFGLNINYDYNEIRIKSPETKFTLRFKTIRDANVLGFNQIDHRVIDGELHGVDKFIPEENSEFEIEVKVPVTEIFQFKDHARFTDLDELQKYMKENTSKIFKTFELGNRCKFSINDTVSYVKFDRYLQKCLGLEKKKYDYVKDKVYEGTRTPKVEVTYNNMLIYCSIVNPIIVGDSHVPLLKSLWFEKFEPDEVANVTVENAMYLPISTSCINNIEINIRDDAGKFIKFVKSAKTSLTLHFRKANNDG
mgnify:FL=1